jgi:hypothetical protein
MSPVASTKNKYAKRSKISEAKFRRLIQYFASDFDAKKIADLTNLNRNTVNRYLTLIRERIAEFCLQESPLKSDGEYVKSHLFRKDIQSINSAAYIKAPVFGVLQCKDKICTLVVPSNDFQITNPCGICEITSPADADNHHTPKKKEKLSGNENLINGIESFLSFAKKRLMKFHGIPESTFFLHLKECEFRFNYRHEDLYPVLLKIIRNNPLC